MMKCSFVYSLFVIVKEIKTEEQEEKERFVPVFPCYLQCFANN